ncbi:uncharacterized protein LOC141855619 [Brevipalpus obovatus]|uniref:uncharacterized protein LOC141855619 n=1 Tax=Brevipalpus obovatus TaxID=246614 RepID=UPI003D9E44E1
MKSTQRTVFVLQTFLSIFLLSPIYCNKNNNVTSVVKSAASSTDSNKDVLPVSSNSSPATPATPIAMVNSPAKVSAAKSDTSKPKNGNYKRNHNYQRSFMVSSGVRPYEYGYNTGIHPYTYSWTDQRGQNPNQNVMQGFNEPTISAPDDGLNTIPLEGNDDGGGENANGGDLQGILPNDFGSDSASDTDFPIQDNQESPGLGIPDLNIGSSDNNPFSMMSSLASEDNFIGVPGQSRVNYRNIW